MNAKQRDDSGRAALGGYVSGPEAATEPTARAVAKLSHAASVLLVEGVSDQIAVETVAARQGRSLETEGVLVLPMGGAHGAARFLAQLGPRGAGLRLAGLCDAGEERIFREGLTTAGLGSPSTRAEMERLGFYVCVEDLEDEMIRALGPRRIEHIFSEQGDLGRVSYVADATVLAGTEGRRANAQVSQCRFA
jgi:hypothetical protein